MAGGYSGTTKNNFIILEPFLEEGALLPLYLNDLHTTIMHLEFTLRLESTEVEKIEALKILFGKNTRNGAIKQAIREFENLNNRYTAEIEKTNAVKEKVKKLTSISKKTATTLSELNTLYQNEQI